MENKSAELKGSLETIRKHSCGKLIDTIDGHFAEIQKAQDKETTEQAQPAQEAAKQPEAEAAAPELPEETAPAQEKEAQTEPEADTGAEERQSQPPTAGKLPGLSLFNLMKLLAEKGCSFD